MITTEDLAFFHVLAQAQSLAEAARKLNVTPPAVTQRLRALEARVGVKLIDRTSRRLALTDEGELIASEGLSIIEAMESLTERVATRTSQVAGHLRVAAPYGFGRHHVSPVVEAFAAAHPAVTITFELSESPIRQLTESWDIVVHIGALQESDRVVTTLAPNRRILCAAPAYLQRGIPLSSPDDLASHRCLALRENNEDVTLWSFHHPRHGRKTVRIKPMMSSNDGEVVRDWARAGLGIVVRSEWDVAKDIADGRLQEIMPDWSLPSADVVALMHARKGRSRRSSAFLMALREALATVPWRGSRT